MARLGTPHCGKPGTVRGRAQQRINEGIATRGREYNGLTSGQFSMASTVVALSVAVTILVFLAS